MLKALAAATLALAISVPVLLGGERLIHRLTHNPDRSYRWGVGLFSVLIAGWVFLTNLGR
jgi:hypothetical protein